MFIVLTLFIMNETQQSLNQQVRRKNHKKLAQQNIKLIAQLKRLQVQIEALDNPYIQKRQDNQHLSSLKFEAQSQERQIKQLKELIENEKHANLKQNVMYIRKEEDELTSLKKQLQNLAIQKGLVTNSHNDKVKKLTDNQPLQKHKQQIQGLWAKTKKQNRQLNLKMVQLQRQIRKYHNLKEMSKDSPGLSYKDNQMKMAISQIERLNNQMKNIESKWKTNISQLDKQYFTSKNTLTSCQKAIEELQREEQVWKRRSSNLRDQKQLESDRARLSKITSIKTVEEPRISSVQHKKIRDFKRILIDEENAKKVSRLAKLASSLSRAESSPNPPTSIKQSIDLKFKRQQNLVKQDGRYKISKEISQKGFDSSKIQKKKSFKDQKILKIDKNKTNEAPRAVILKSEHQQAKNQNEVISHRQKHRIKSNAAVHLAQSLKRKAQEVKQLNKKLQIQQQQYEQGKNKNKKQRGKQPVNNALTLSQPENNIKQQSLNKRNEYKGGQNSPQIKKQKNEKPIQEVQFLKVKSHQKIKINEQKNLIKQIKVRQKELVQDLQFNKKVEKKEKLPLKNSMKIIIKDQKNSSNDEKPIVNISKSPKNISSPKSNIPKNNSKNQLITKIKKLQNVQIPQNQKSPAKSQKKGSQINLEIQLQDLEEGKPKMIKRKRRVEGNLVTTGTST